ncbi:MAG: hypothetical protein RR471_12705 [Bacteroides sp.]
MKKIVLLLAVLLLSSGFKSKAADWTELQHEISLSYGALPVFDLLNYYENHFSNKSVNFYDDKGKFGSFNVSYLFYPDEMVGFGVIYSYTNSDKYIMDKTNSIGNLSNSFHSIMPSVKVNWYNYDYITLYSRINIGITIATAEANYFDESKITEKEDPYIRNTEITPFFMYQVSPIGIEVGRAIAGFVEVGFGHMGTAMIGLRYRM